MSAAVEMPTAPSPAPSSPWTEEVGKQPLSWRYWLGRIDLRPIALLRIALGLFVAFDVAEFAPNLRAWFSDEGVLPRWALMSQWARSNRFCLLDSFGSPSLVWVYWTLAMVAALCMALGYRSRIASAATFVFVAGFQERLPPLFDGSDTVLRMVLFWHAFTASGNVWSVDALIAKARGFPLERTGAALPVRFTQLQVGWVYLCSVFYKAQGSMWHDGTAVHYALHLNHVFARDIAPHLDALWVSMFITYFTLVLESSFIFLTNAPVLHRPLKAIGLLGGVGLHAGIYATINVGHFSYLMPLTYLSMLEPEWAQRAVDGVTGLVGFDRMHRFHELLRRLPRPIPTGMPLWMTSWVRPSQVALLGVAVLASWLSMPAQYRTELPRAAETGLQYASLWSNWDMFAPNPLSTDYHLSLPADFEDGTTADLFGGQKGGPGEERGFFFTRWWKYMENVTGGGEVLPLEWGRYVCREHNQRLAPGQPRLYTFTLFKDNQRIPPIGQAWPPVERQTVWVHRCFDLPQNGQNSPAVATQSRRR
jgi:hypothetical protein